VKQILTNNGIIEKLNTMEQKALLSRAAEEAYLVHTSIDEIYDKNLSFFYPSEESEEFE